MKQASLFSGIGGFDLAAEWMGWENVFHCEWNEFGQKILKYYWPNAQSYGDIKQTDFTIWRGRIDVLTGGFPCQPYSLAGKRLGKEDERHLWPEMLRAIREIRPRWIVGENVHGLLSWNGGLVFDEVQADLEAEGYEVAPVVLPAASVNAPHRRDRVWFIAYSASNRWIRQGQGIEIEERLQPRSKSTRKLEGRSEGLCSNEPVANTAKQQGKSMQYEQPNTCKSKQRESGGNTCKSNTRSTPDPDGLNRRGKWAIHKRNRRQARDQFEGICGEYASDTNSRRLPSQKHRQAQSRWVAKTGIPNDWSNFPTQSAVRSGNDGIPTELVRARIREDSMGILSEKEIDKIISKATTKYVEESIKAYGNAIVPQVVYEIFKAIEKTEKHLNNEL